MKSHPHSTIEGFSLDDLVDDLTPVRRITAAQGWLIGGAMTLLAVTLVTIFAGLREDVLAGDPSAMVVQRSLALLLLGCAALAAVVDSIQPRVGRHSNAWALALLVALSFPILTLGTAMHSATMPMSQLSSPSGLWCLGISLTSAMMIAAALTLWARRGAVTVANRTAWLIGLSAGAFGTLAYSLHCTSTTLAYAGIWYTAAVASSAVAGRAILPRLLRW